MSSVSASQSMAALNSFSLLRYSLSLSSPLTSSTTASFLRSNAFLFRNPATTRAPLCKLTLSPPAPFSLLHSRNLTRTLCHATSSTNDEEVAAKAAAANADTGAPTIFDKIIAKEIPSTIVYEDEKVLAFRDVNPQAPIHILVIPKFRDGLTQLSKAEKRHTDILGHLLYAAKIAAEKEGIQDGFRVVINDGPAGCQSVYHLHLHVLGGRQMKWPPG